MLGVRLYIPHILMIFSAEAVVVFNKPPSGGETIKVVENSVPHSRLYDLQATDSAGNAPSFSIASSLCESHQNPSIPTFNLNKVDQLLVPAGGLDAESCIQYRIVFQVNAGGSKATSDPLIIKVENVNDLPPRFSKSVYKGEVWKNDKSAQTTFAIWSNGSVYVNDQSGLSALASPTVLTIQASDGSLTSDGGLTSTATLNITVHDDPCKIRGSTVTSSSCQNGGTCTSNRERYNCTCLDGYIGDHCEKVNYCFSHPCKNNGDCINSESGYICNCSYPFARTEPINQNCTILDYCEPNQCHNSGSCINGTNDKNGYKCLCQENFTGLKCETLDYCVQSRCENGGTCVNGTNGYTCSCPINFTGTKCETLDFCAQDQCLNGGTCINSTNDYTCSCPENFTGKRCDTLDYCAQSRCENGGTCVNGTNGYICSCPINFTGTKCETLDYCAQNQCVNGGTCINSTNDYTCSCPENFIGKRCDTLNYCSQSRCENGGTCVNGTDGYNCSCSINFTGKKCETSWTLHSGNKTKTPNVGLITGICVSSSGACSIVVFVVVYYNKKKKEEINIKSNDTGANERQTSQPTELSELKTVVQQTDGCC